MKRIACLLALVVSSGIILAQAKDKAKSFNFHGQIFELNLKDSSEKPVMGIPIEIWSGDDLITTVESGPKGKYNISLVHYPEFTLKFGKAPYVSKVVKIDADGFQRAAEFGVVNLDLDISLFKNKGYMGMDFMNYTPVAIAKFNKKKGLIEWDLIYADKINERVAGIIAANEQ
jgi:hypothetical protein